MDMLLSSIFHNDDDDDDDSLICYAKYPRTSSDIICVTCLNHNVT